MSMKNSNDTIRNRIRDLLDCSAVPQLLRAPSHVEYKILFLCYLRYFGLVRRYE